MGVELCKFTGGTCNLCGDGDVCKRDPPVDMSVVKRFIEDPGTELPYPTCEHFEGNWGRVFTMVDVLVRSYLTTWDGIAKSGGVVLKVHPGVRLDPSQWFQDGCEPVTTTLIEKNPYYLHDKLGVGMMNGVAVCHGVPFAVETRPDEPVITRPVVHSERPGFFQRLCEFESIFGPIYNSQYVPPSPPK